MYVDVVGSVPVCVCVWGCACMKVIQTCVLVWVVCFGIVGPGKVRQVCSGMRFTGELQGRAAGRL